MKWFSFSLKVVALAVVALVVGSLAAKETAAQYPQPSGSATLTGSSTTASVGGSVGLTLTVVDSAGSPVAGKTCTMYIYSQPGNDASLTQDSDTTDAEGVITGTLYAGTTQGTVKITVNCGDVHAALSVAVAGAVVSPPQAPVEPVTGQITMPPTGLGPATDGEPYGMGLIAALLAGGLMALAGGSVLFLTARRVRGDS